MNENEPRIFLCHASDDKARVRELYHQLKAAGYHPWLDEEDLLPGQDWRAEIKKVITDPSNLVVVCLSRNSVTKRGVVQKEIIWALDVLEETPEDTIYLIPARLEDCQVPNRLSDLHWVNLFEPGGFDRLTRALDFEIGKFRAGARTQELRQAPEVETSERLKREIRPPLQEEIIAPIAPEPVRMRTGRAWGWLLFRLVALGLLIGIVVLVVGTFGMDTLALIDGVGEYIPIPISSVPTPKPQPPSNASLHDTWTRPTDGMEMVYVPGRTFEMGSTDGPDNEQPVHAVTLDSFWIDKTEVTNAQYARCVADGTCSPPSESGSWTRESYYGDSQFDNYPVIYVSWYDTDTYCRWAGGRLPTEAEWEYAARGPDGHIYPWGNDPPNEALLNYGKNVGDTTRVGAYPGGASWVGAVDMAGNVWEWVADWYDSDYYASSSALNPTGPAQGDGKVLRGGSWLPPEENVRAANRNGNLPTNRHFNIGFRCVVEPGNWFAGLLQSGLLTVESARSAVAPDEF